MVTVTRHIRHPNGSVELVLLIADADPEMLADVGGYVAAVPGGTTVSYTWSAGMAPQDAEALCTAHVRAVLTTWAAAWSGCSIDLTA
jgi:hypothetical protein